MLDQIEPQSVTVPRERPFVFEEAFSRTLGWVTAAELQRLRSKRVAIAGLGGVGGAHAVTLARLGISKFHLADFDHFELANFNRQFGATVSNLDRPKTEVLCAAVRDINPEAEIELWQHKLNPEDARQFLEGADIYVDSIDFFALEMRRALFAQARTLGIPAITAAPIGTGVAWLVFTPDGMSCDDYFGFSNTDLEDNYVKFLVGLAPRGLHRPFLVDPSRIDFENRKTPSTPMGCALCAGVAATETLKLLLNRDGIRSVPWFHQFDASAGRSVSGKSWFGSKNPLYQLKLSIARALVRKKTGVTKATASMPRTLSEHVIDLARWAPSGDNEQPWSFSNLEDKKFRISIDRANPENPYEFAAGRPVWLAAGGLLEAISLSAERMGSRALVQKVEIDPGNDSGPALQYDIELASQTKRKPDPLGHFLETRSVDRTSYRQRRLSERERATLEKVLPAGMSLNLLETLGERFSAARLNSDATVLRMGLSQAHPVHVRVFRFDSDRPETGLPMRSLPLDPLSYKMLRWTSRTWKRSILVNKTLAGARMASIQTDILPGLASSAHFALLADTPLDDSVDSWIDAGRAMLRFWLTAESLGLVLQPSFAPLAFGHSAVHGGIDFTGPQSKRARSLADRLETSIADLNRIVFLGRIGQARRPVNQIRSLRRPAIDHAD